MGAPATLEFQSWPSGRVHSCESLTRTRVSAIMCAVGRESSAPWHGEGASCTGGYVNPQQAVHPAYRPNRPFIVAIVPFIVPIGLGRYMVLIDAWRLPRGAIYVF